MSFHGEVKTYYLLLLLFLLSLGSTAQKKDSLWQVWTDQSANDTIRFEALTSLYWNICYSYPDSAFVIAELIHSQAINRNNKLYLAKALKLKGIIKDVQGEYDQSHNYYQKALDITETDSLFAESVRICRNIGFLYRMQGELNLALKFYQKSLEVSQKINWPEGITGAYNGLGNVYQEQKNLPLALESYQKSLKISEQQKDTNSMVRAYVNIGLVYLSLKELDKSIDYFEQSMNYYEKIGDEKRLIGTYSNLGIVYKDLEEYDKAKQYLTDGLILAKELNFTSEIVNSQINLGNIYKLQGELTAAMDYYTKALNFLDEHRNPKLLAKLYFNIGSLKNKSRDYSTGIKWCDKAYDLSVQYQFLEEKMLSCECLTESYKNLGNIYLAYDYLRQFYNARDSLTMLENDEEVNRMAMQYAYEKQHLADSLAMEEQKLIQKLAYQENLNKERMQRNASIYFVVALLIFAILLFSRLYLTRKTNRKLAEKNQIIAQEKQRAEESERAKEQFFNNVSHEFRTPLTLILGPLDKLIDSTTDESFKEQLGMVKRNANRLHNMINELLNLYKLESGSVKVNVKKGDLGQFVYRYVQSFEPLAKQKSIKLEFKADGNYFEVYFDSEKIEKVLSNLLSNAFKFVDEGGKVIVTIESKRNKINSSDGVIISVADDGIGIPKDKIDHVFDRFYQVDESLSRNYAGTGIGLSLTKELVELHHGWIKAESEKGKGATFSFYLPYGKQHFKEEDLLDDISDGLTPVGKEEQQPENLPAEAGGKKKGLPVLLVVEDNPDMRLYIKNDLRDKYKVIEASNGKEGLEKAIEHIPDLIISDVMMPRMDGNEMSFKLKQDQRTSHIPVILVTARTTTEQKIEGLETGVDAYLSKPFNSRELQVRIKNLINQRQQLRKRYSGDLSQAIRIADTDIASMDQQFLEKALKVVEENIGDAEFTVESFGSKMAMSRVQLHRKLTALTDQSASRFIRTIRLKHAADLLAKGGATVTDTAYKYGFNNMSYFAKCFSEEYNMTPSEWSIKHNGGNKKSL